MTEWAHAQSGRWACLFPSFNLTLNFICIKRKKSAILQANPVDSNASALYDTISDKTDKHIYDDIRVTRIHICEDNNAVRIII